MGNAYHTYGREEKNIQNVSRKTLKSHFGILCLNGNMLLKRKLQKIFQ
jgi:hypothetical protein